MNADPRVMEHFVAPLDRAASDAFVDRIEERRDERGYSLWAVEVTDRRAPLAGRFIGFVGLWDTAFEAHFTPAIEVGWRLAADAWGHGYATEAATASVEDGFARVGLPEILSFTAAVNLASRAVMERIGLVRDPGGDFDHPAVPEGHPIRRHVLYRFPDLEVRRAAASARSDPSPASAPRQSHTRSSRHASPRRTSS